MRLTWIVALLVVEMPGLEARGTPWYRADFHSCDDGDTCRFSFRLGLNSILADQRVRLCDIDAPEMRGDWKPLAEDSRRTLVAWIESASHLYVEVPQLKDCKPRGLCDKRDGFGRLLGWVWACTPAGNCINLNEQMVEREFAKKSKHRCRRRP